MTGELAKTSGDVDRLGRPSFGVRRDLDGGSARRGGRSAGGVQTSLTGMVQGMIASARNTFRRKPNGGAPIYPGANKPPDGSKVSLNCVRSGGLPPGLWHQPKKRLRERADVLRGWLTPKSRKLLST